MPQTSLDRFLEELDSIAPSATAHDIWNRTAAFFAQNGFDKLIYIDLQPQGVDLLSTLPQAWVARYHSENYVEIDPFFQYCGTTYQPVSTGAAYADQHKGLTAPQQSLIHEAAEFGIVAGFSSTERIMCGNSFAGWNIGSSLSRNEVDRLRLHFENGLRFAAHRAHDHLTRARHHKKILSMREWECLRLLAQGQRNKDIARSLSISTAAVELYLRNARIKLGAATREQSVALATARGLFDTMPDAPAPLAP